MRPQTFDAMLGQAGVVGADGTVQLLVREGQVRSTIFWGPPGCGKTTVARIIGAAAKLPFEQVSATNAGIAHVKEMLQAARNRKRLAGQPTVLFVDEIHRYNKLQQDAFLPFVEEGSVVLLGATTENPSFEVNRALLSRCQVLVLKPLDAETIVALLRRALADAQLGLGGTCDGADDEALRMIGEACGGDARYALNMLESAAMLASASVRAAADAATRVHVTAAHVAASMQRTNIHHDKDGENHYDIISALHKSIRGGDADASVYWMMRMLEGGDEPLFIARRLIVRPLDIGNADPQALSVCVAAYQACHFLGMPECDAALAQATVYLANARKSNAVYVALGKAREHIRAHPNIGVPMHIRNAPTQLMKHLGYAEGYLYPPDHGYRVAQQYMPDALVGQRFYDPSNMEPESARRV